MEHGLHALAAVIQILGLSLVLVGSVATARAVIIKQPEADAITFADQTSATYWGVLFQRMEEMSKQAAALNLIQQSRNAYQGLLLIAGGAGLQIIGVLVDAI
jgi:hypothetical protein